MMKNERFWIKTELFKRGGEGEMGFGEWATTIDTKGVEKRHLGCNIKKIKFYPPFYINFKN